MSGKKIDNWNQVAETWPSKGYHNKILAEHKRKTHLSLLARWTNIADGHKILKTDLFAEAFDSEQFIFDIAEANGNLVGIDRSSKIVIKAKYSAERHGLYAGKYLCCDVKHLPLQDNSIDLIISDSTLDHFPRETDIVTALEELWRVLRVGGTLILTMDNKSNLTYPPYISFRLWMRLRLSPYFIGKTISPNKQRHTMEEIGFSIEQSTAIFHYPHPDVLVRWLESFLRKISRGRIDNTIRSALSLLDKLEGKKTEYLTGRYIAIKALKK
jgi:SAM-dependent methyltransferase